MRVGFEPTPPERPDYVIWFMITLVWRLGPLGHLTTYIGLNDQ